MLSLLVGLAFGLKQLREVAFVLERIAEEKESK